MFKAKGFESRGPDPLSGKGGYVNPNNQDRIRGQTTFSRQGNVVCPLIPHGLSPNSPLIPQTLAIIASTLVVRAHRTRGRSKSLHRNSEIKGVKITSLQIEGYDEMKYQLAIQFSDEILTYDQLIEMEDALITALHGTAEVDGHDIGVGEVNFFILTDTPRDTCNDAINIVEVKVEKDKYRAAYREIGGELYTVLWPPNSVEFKIA